MIDTRQEMLIGLAEAAELEHNLACLYLFAAFSMKTTPAVDGVSADQALLLTGWKETILDISKQEMGHLGTVCNLLTAVGGVPHFRRANFPQPPKYYPPDIDFTLQRFGRMSLARFIEFERPETEPPLLALDVAPDPLLFTRIGDLYRKIRMGFEAIDEAKLFINLDAPQDSNWSASVDVFPVKNRAEALAAIDAILVQGEGTPTAPGDSHYERFKTIALELQQAIQTDPTFDPARNVANNPQSRKPRDAVAGSLISDAVTREVAELFNVLYGLMLRMLVQYYAYAGETAAQRTQLRTAAVRAMRFLIRPLGEALTRLPIGAGQPGVVAGAGFEVYGEEGFSTRPRVAWDIFIERLEIHAAQAQTLSGQVGSLGPVLTTVATRLTTMKNDLVAVKPT